MNQVFIRGARPEDCSSVLALIRELAVYERAPDEVIIDEEQMRRYGFGEKKFFQIMVAESPGQSICGMALCYPKFSTWKGMSLFLEDIVVSEKFRNQGIGSALFEEVIRYGKSKGYYRLEWQVLNWNEPAIRFYQKYGAEITDQWLNGRIILPEYSFP